MWCICQCWALVIDAFVVIHIACISYVPMQASIVCIAPVFIAHDHGHVSPIVSISKGRGSRSRSGVWALFHCHSFSRNQTCILIEWNSSIHRTLHETKIEWMEINQSIQTHYVEGMCSMCESNHSNPIPWFPRRRESESGDNLQNVWVSKLIHSVYCTTSVLV